MAKRVIRLTEADLENIVRKVLLEQSNVSFGSGTQQVPVGTKTELQDINVNLANQVFEPGKYKINSLGAEGTETLNETLLKIVQFLKDNPDSPLNIEIVVGESVVPNYDREKCQAKDYSEGCKLSEGELGKLRGEELVKFLNTSFKQYETDGVISKAPTITATPTVIVGQKYKTYGNDPGNKKYLEDQFIKFNATLTGEVETPVYENECLVDLKVTLQYINEKNNNQFPCRGIHRCDKATYNVYLNETKLGVANLDNENDGGNRKSEFVVNTDTVKKIVEGSIFKSKETITLWISCAESDGKCHNSAVEVKIENKKGEVKSHSCLKPINVEIDTKESYTELTEGHLLYMDKCGNVLDSNVADSADAISMSDLASAEEKRVHQEAVNNVVNYFKENPFSQANMGWFRNRGTANITIESIDGKATLSRGRTSLPAVILTVKTNNSASKIPTGFLPSGEVKSYFEGKEIESVTIPPDTNIKVVVPMSQVNVPTKSKEKFEEELNKKLNTRTFYRLDINGEPYIVNAAGASYVDVTRLLGKDERFTFNRGLSKINYV